MRSRNGEFESCEKKENDRSEGELLRADLSAVVLGMYYCLKRILYYDHKKKRVRRLLERLGNIRKNELEDCC